MTFCIKIYTVAVSGDVGAEEDGHATHHPPVPVQRLAERRWHFVEPPVPHVTHRHGWTVAAQDG